MADRAEFALLYIRAGMTHLAPEIRNDALSTLEWMVEAAPEELVACPGGWFKTLKAFMSMLGWATSVGSTKWSVAAKATFGKGGKSFPRQLEVLALFLRAGLGRTGHDQQFDRGTYWSLWDADVHMIPTNGSPFAHLNLFGPERDEESEMYTERESRQRVFAMRFKAAVVKGIESAKKEAGELGRVGFVLQKVLRETMDDYDEVDVPDSN